MNVHQNFVLISIILAVSGPVFADKASVSFTNLKPGKTYDNPVEICMKATGVVIEPASNGVNPGHGHLHLLVDYPLPSDLSKPLPFDLPDNVIHLGDGTNCRKLTLAPGKHAIRALVADGSHIPGNPITKLIDIKVK
jgi:hypothetical protein